MRCTLGSTKNMRRKILITTLVCLTIIILGYLSKPDRGGINRCSSEFSISEITQLELTSEPLYAWDLFEGAKFRFKINDYNFKKLSRIVADNGYSSWRKGELFIGSFTLGTRLDDDLVFCSKYINSRTYYWAYSKMDGILYAITFRH